MKTVLAVCSSYMSKHIYSGLRGSLHFSWCSAFLVHVNGVLTPLKQQTFESVFQSIIFLNCDLLSSCVSSQNGDILKSVTMLMLMLAQVNAFCNSHYQILIKLSTVCPKQVKYDDCLLGQIPVLVS